MPTIIERPFFPIIYVRGYAGSDSEIEDAVAEPYIGFNVGPTKFRQCWDPLPVDSSEGEIVVGRYPRQRFT